MKIKSKAERKIDKQTIFFTGNILQYSLDSMVVMVSDRLLDSPDKTSFSGVVMHPGNFYPVGHCSDDWSKTSFSQFEGKLSLETFS